MLKAPLGGLLLLGSRPINAFLPLVAAARSMKAAAGRSVGYGSGDSLETGFTELEYTGSTYFSTGNGKRTVSYQRMADRSLAGWLTIGNDKHESDYFYALKGLVEKYFGGKVVGTPAIDYITFEAAYIDMKTNAGQVITLHFFEDYGVSIMGSKPHNLGNEAEVQRVADWVQQQRPFKG